VADAKQRFAEANDLFLHPLATSPAEAAQQRAEMVDLLTELDERIVALEGIRDELAAAEVIVEGVTAAEVQQIGDALRALDVAIRRTETFQANLATLTAALGAINTLTSAARRGAAGGAAGGGTADLTAAASLTGVRSLATPRVDRRSTASPRFVCRMPHHEDVTDAVQKALGDDIGVAAVRAPAARTAVTRRITVKCSEGHVNVFEIG
jgi:hypothetical protein